MVSSSSSSSSESGPKHVFKIYGAETAPHGKDSLVIREVEAEDKTAGELVIPKTALDLKDGFIHLSTRTQLKSTLKNHFSTATRVKILVIQFEDIPADTVKFEKAGLVSRKYPHVYGDVSWTAVKKVFIIPNTSEMVKKVLEVY